MALRHVLFKTLERQIVNTSFNVKTISQTDFKSLGKLMLEAYRGTVDYDGESLEDSVGEIKGTLEGKYGNLIAPASFVIEVDGASAAAVIFTFNDKEKIPLLTFAMTSPAFKNKGMSKFLINKGLNSLLDLGYKECFLVVTDGNQPAHSMYEKMGFKTSPYTYRSVNTKDTKEMRFIAEIDARMPGEFDSVYTFVESAVDARLEQYHKLADDDFFDVVTHDSKIVAFHIVKKLPYPPELHLGSVFTTWVHPDYRGQGLAGKLKHRAENWGKQSGLVFLQTNVHTKNKRMTELNENNGYKPVWTTMRKFL